MSKIFLSQTPQITKACHKCLISLITMTTVRNSGWKIRLTHPLLIIISLREYNSAQFSNTQYLCRRQNIQSSNQRNIDFIKQDKRQKTRETNQIQFPNISYVIRRLNMAQSFCIFDCYYMHSGTSLSGYSVRTPFQGHQTLVPNWPFPFNFTSVYINQDIIEEVCRASF
jgi:hypothetical protein